MKKRYFIVGKIAYSQAAPDEISWDDVELPKKALEISEEKYVLLTSNKEKSAKINRNKNHVL